MNQVPVHFSLKTPGMYLTWCHKIDLVGFNIKRLEVDRMAASAFGKQYQVIEVMFVRKVQVAVRIQIMAEAIDQHIILLIIGEFANIIYREVFFHRNANVVVKYNKIVVFIVAPMVVFTD